MLWSCSLESDTPGETNILLVCLLVLSLCVCFKDLCPLFLLYIQYSFFSFLFFVLY